MARAAAATRQQTPQTFLALPDCILEVGARILAAATALLPALAAVTVLR